jgi:hypothetical protein
MLRHHEADGLAVDHPVRGVGQFDQHLVRAGFQADHDQGFAVGVDEVPGGVVDGTWTWPMRGDTSSAPLPNTGTTRKLSARYWMNTRPLANGSASGGSTISFGGGSFSIATSGDGPRISLALWAKAVAG